MPSSLLRHRPHRAWSGTGTFYAGEVGIPYGGWCNGADFTEISKFPEILGELSMRKQCVPGSFLSAHALEPGNEAMAAQARCPGFDSQHCWPFRSPLFLPQKHLISLHSNMRQRVLSTAPKVIWAACTRQLDPVLNAPEIDEFTKSRCRLILKILS